jgi:A/G-specific adenine glycosylase
MLNCSTWNLIKKNIWLLNLNGQWLSPEQAIAKGVPTAMKKLISTSRS